MEPSFIWQVEVCSESGLWKDMDSEWGRVLSEFYAEFYYMDSEFLSYAKNPDIQKLLQFDSPLIILGKVTYCHYVVDFQKCLQTNETTGTTRKIRKVQMRMSGSVEAF